MPFVDTYVVFLLVCLLLQKSSMAHLLNQYVLGETTLRTFFTVAKFSSPAGRKNVICTNVVFLLLVWMLLQTWAVGTMSEKMLQKTRTSHLFSVSGSRC